MNRENLIEAVAQAARECELCFHTGYEYQLNQALKKTPALWLAHQETVKTEGMEDGIRTYALKLTIIDITNRQNTEEPEVCWQQMERKATEICSKIAQAECVRSISNVEFGAAKNSITNRGEISMSVKMNVQVPFLKQKN